MSTAKADKTPKAAATVAATPFTSPFTIFNPFSVVQPAPKFCSNCGEPCPDCQCGCCNNQSVSVTISFNTGLLNLLLSSMPKIKITSNQCGQCGHPAHTGQCDCGCQGQ